MSKKFIRVLIMVLVLTSIMSTCAFAAQAPETFEPQNSNYISKYVSYVYSPSSGVAQVWIEIRANATSDKVGANYITLQSSTDEVNWSNDYTFYPSVYTNMVATNSISNITYVQKNVAPGHYYRAVLNFFVEDNGGSDNRSYVTDSVYIP